MKKKKKDKITYIDDGRSFADLSGIKGGLPRKGGGASSSFSDIWRTYWSAVKMMLFPMLVVIGFLIVCFLVMALLFWLM